MTDQSPRPGPVQARGARVGGQREPLRAHRDPLARDSGRMRVSRDRQRTYRKQSWLGRFIATYGWRAYVLPLVGIISAIVLYQTEMGVNDSSAESRQSAADAPATGPAGASVLDAPPRGLAAFDANLPTGTLPEGGPFTQAGDKSWRIVPGVTAQVGRGSTRVFHYTIEVENGLDSTMFGGDTAFATMVDQTLANPKSWTHNPQFAFVRVDTDKPDFRISLTSPETVREVCGYEFRLETSCYNPVFGRERQARVVINEARWIRGALPFQGDIGSYRQYLINHEVGHAIGYAHHQACDKQGGLAPVMMQQTFSTSNADASKFDPDVVKGDDKVCRFNPWPFPIA